MPKNSLGLEIYNKIYHYMDIDNPKPHGFLDSICLFFKARGSKGRERARNYLAVLGEMDEQSIRNKVWSDICQPRGNGALGTSRKLRERLLEGLCSYYSVPDKRIDQLYRQQMCFSMTFFDSAARPPSAYAYFNAMKSAIKEKFAQMGFMPSVRQKKSRSC